jgi:di/tripeptidase
MESWMEVDLRSEDPSRLKVLDGILRKAVQQGLDDENNLKRKGPSLTVEVKLIGNRPAGIQQPSMPLVQRAMASVKLLGATPKLAVVSTNANLPISLGVPAITIGVGGQGDGAHSINEWWRNDKGFLAIQNALLILLAEAGYKK